MIWKKEIEEVRRLMGSKAPKMSDKEIKDLIFQIKKMVVLAVEFVEREAK